MLYAGDESESPMGAVTWIVISLIAGWLAARFIYSAVGLLRILIVGVFGAVLGALLLARLGVHNTGFLGRVRRRGDRRRCPAVDLAGDPACLNGGLRGTGAVRK